MFYFYPRPPRGGRRLRERPAGAPQAISIHALREEGDKIWQFVAKSFRISIHALREEGDIFLLAERDQPFNFYPRPPRGGRRFACGFTRCRANFYPRPPRGGRQTDGVDLLDYLDFYPRPPRGGRLSNVPGSLGSSVFLSTPSARRATQFNRFRGVDHLISIHALREEGDAVRVLSPPARPISIHALREEGDHCRR